VFVTALLVVVLDGLFVDQVRYFGDRHTLIVTLASEVLGDAVVGSKLLA
jgi:hypothetical protein